MTVGRAFGHSWWGRAWIDAIEQHARLDPSRLPRGRTYARAGRVTAITLEPGSIRAYVKGSRAEPYRVELEVRTFTDQEWATAFDVIGAKAEHVAALVDGELDPGLVDDLIGAGIDPLPRAGEIDSWCSCPDWAEPCKHSAAVHYLVADELDADPFALLRLRGRSRQQILAAIRRLRAAAAETGAVGPQRPKDEPGTPVDEGTPAAMAWTRRLGRLPSPPPLRTSPSRPTAQSVDPPPDATFTAAGLRSLAVDAADRAWAALAEGTALGLDVGIDDDTVRRAVDARHLDGFAEVARRLGTSPRTLARQAAAWELGGHDGLAMLNERLWRADPLVMSAARLGVEKATRGHVRGEIEGNRLTVGDVQLRLSRTGQWWSFEKRANVWEPLGGPAENADRLIAPRSTGRS